MKVLIVEDDGDMRRLLKIVLAGMDVETEEAPDGESAIHSLETSSEPDLVLLDLHLSRHHVLANRVRVVLEQGVVDVSVGPRDRIRVSGPRGTRGGPRRSNRHARDACAATPRCAPR